MATMKIKKGDMVKVIAGKDINSEGKVIAVNRKDGTVLVEGVNMVSKSTKPNAKNPQGGIVKQEASIHLSNLNPVDPKTGKATRISRKVTIGENGKKTIVRVSKKSGEEIK